jgi:Protein of unknown function (DUF3485)
MPTSTRRHALALVLILAAGAAEIAVAHRERAEPPVPAIPALIAGTDWRVETAYQPGGWGMAYRQWSLRDPSGERLLLFIGATARLQTALHWTGELGFEGDGYEVTERGDRWLRLPDGRAVAVGRAVIDRLWDHRVVEYGVASHDGITARGAGSPLRTAWEALTDTAGPYYLVRVATQGADAQLASEHLLASVLTRLEARLG